MSEKMIIEQCGPLKGSVKIGGAKNAVLPVLAASLLTDSDCVIRNVPDLSDVESMCALVESLGAKTVWDKPGGKKYSDDKIP